MEKLEFYYSGEFATKSPAVINEGNVGEVEIYDRHNNNYLDLENKSLEEVAGLLSDVAANGREISEQQYSEIVSK